MAQANLSGESQPCAKLFGRAFYESIGSPKMIVAPMVDRSEFAWRLLTRSFLNEERSKSLLAYTPMFHARLFGQTPRVRDDYFKPTKESLTSKKKSIATPWMDGNPKIDRPLFVQFCANKPEELLEAAEYVAPYCDAVDLNLGCPQGIARAGHYGAFLQEDWASIYKMINKLHNELSVPVTAKMRILETPEKTLDYAKMILSAGASILTVHGRRREQKGHNTGVADWSMIRYLRDNLPPETVLFANGNILNSGDVEACLAATGADGIMSAEGNLSDPTIFAQPPEQHNPREYWYDTDGKGGYRVDAVFRRYIDIIYTYSLEKAAPERPPLYIPGDSTEHLEGKKISSDENQSVNNKKRKRGDDKKSKLDPSLKAMQGHLFQLLRPLISTHTDIRDTLARTRCGDMDGFERVLAMVEEAVRNALDQVAEPVASKESLPESETVSEQEMTPKQKTEAIYKRPWWVCQPYIRPLPEEAIKSGALKISRKEATKITMNEVTETESDPIQRSDELDGQSTPSHNTSNETPKAALVCG
ncbi:tRNA dihydrouridine synthase [Elasticomyces elasticus]|uniref:tRNA-dihydrouridine(16/17) synthase [NAD(P)(+)] n=1 Tax=Exophiala sideris TaxID=1016849 RepID=A0ABR0IYP6_9EURO|nr:tRNA dihydrouridine synthase [Elasticomyces elasticus]KAK5022348.1 tRNA dihydrouridine synthase [Exophiala sideris]KAK5027160.1 tRNA dihydrouridine synthase [Exophiala sideris]KAK5051735.1 tRNA dihydrouridine synthase [Exophiala sideris]KAK5177700.1 tRNA dihydrouridine synthase [Eurotiomycetes sp. CCFEE 6388]